MSVVSCKIRSRRANYGLTENQKTWIYLIDCNTVMTTDEVLAGAMLTGPTPLPPRGVSMGGSAFVLSVDIDEQKEGNGKRWIATVNGGALPPDQEPDPDPGGGGGTNPLQRPIVFWLERSSKTEPYDKDRDGNVIVNTAGQPYLEPPVREVHVPVIAFRRNFATWEEIADINAALENSTNRDAFPPSSSSARPRPAETLLYLPAESSERQIENDITFYTAEFRMEQHSHTYIEIVSRGLKHFTGEGVAEDRSLVDATDDEGNLVSEPVLLNDQGQRMPEGQLGIFTQHFVHPRRNYSALLDLNKTTTEIITAANTPATP